MWIVQGIWSKLTVDFLVRVDISRMAFFSHGYPRNYPVTRKGDIVALLSMLTMKTLLRRLKFNLLGEFRDVLICNGFSRRYCSYSLVLLNTC